MKYAVEMGSDVRIHTPSFIKNGSGIQKTQTQTQTQTHRHTDTKTHEEHGDGISLISF
jgi:hypothetical protein